MNLAKLLYRTAITVTMLLMGFTVSSACAAGGLVDGRNNEIATPPPENRPASQPEGESGRAGATVERKAGLLRYEKGAFDGYTLFAPLHDTKTYLIDMQGEPVHIWESDAPPGQAVYLLDNGNLLRTECLRENQYFFGGGMGGRIREYSWDGSIVWEFIYSDQQHCQHHDIEPLPDGNILLIAWDKKSRAEAIVAGRDPQLLGDQDFWPDEIVEVEPQGPRGGKIVWRWSIWDHLVQDLDPAKENYGVVAEHPELVNINGDREVEQISPDELEKLEALGYVTPAPRGRTMRGEPDWTHINSVDYNAELDQIVLSVHRFSEIWVIDHSTTTEQAASHIGGHGGRGGDLLYRWGNPRSYDTGAASQQQLFSQHDAHWIEPGLKGAGDLIVFNNGNGRTDRFYSTIDEISPPLDKDGGYACTAGTAFGPEKPVWSYAAEKQESFFSSHISGVQRLPNGNTLICSGEEGRFFEVDQNGQVVWEYVSPFEGEARPPLLGMPWGPPPGPPGFSPEGPHAAAGRGRADGRPRDAQAQVGRSGGRRRGPRGMGPGGRGPGGKAFVMGGGIFRATRIAPDHPGLAGKVLRAGRRITGADAATPRAPEVTP